MAKLQFTAPAESAAHAALLKAATSLGLDESALRQLLWLLNGHPDLVSHARILQNLSAILTSPIFDRDCVTIWASAWIEMVPEWAKACALLSHNAASLSKLPGLSEFDRKARSSSQHPLDKLGLGRHAIPGALWTAFELLSHYPPPAWDNSAGVAYFRLQAHVFAAVAESRFRLSSLQFYERYTGENERPVAPIRNKAVSPAIRELSFSLYSPLLTQFPQSDSTIEYAEQFDPDRFDFDLLDSSCRQDAKKAVAAISRFFRRFRMVLGGWRPSQSSRFGATYTDRTGSSRRPGFIPASEVSGVYRRSSPHLDDEASPAKAKGTTLFIDRDPTGKDNPQALEMSGLAPEESLEEFFTLYPPDEARVELLKLHRQNLAITARAQSFPFDNATLTDQEIRRVWQVTSEDIAACLNSSTPAPSIVTQSQASAATKLSLCFGQPMETLSRLRILERPFLDDLTFQVSPEAYLPALIVTPAEQRDCVTSHVLGLALPGIHPDYQTELAEDLEDIDRPYQGYFILPDLMGVCEELIRLRQHTGCTSREVFDVDANVLSQQAKKLIQACGSPRITLARIQQVLGRLVAAFEGDVCLAWVLTANEKEANQPRLFYTRYRVDRLIKAFRRSTRRIARAVGYGISLQALQASDSVTNAASVGARFVISLDELRELVAFLRQELSHPTTDIGTLAGFVAYSNLYVLYSVIFQSLDSSIRAINAPSQVYFAWHSQSDRDEQLVSLSDKDSAASEKARLATLTPGLSAHFFHFYEHQSLVGQTGGFSLDYAKVSNKAGPFFFLTENYEVEPITAGWVAEQLYQFSGYPIPANFHRSFLRTELLERDCPAELVDAFLGHANNGESPSGPLSTFDYTRYRSEITRRLQQIHQDLSLEPIQSQLVATQSD